MELAMYIVWGVIAVVAIFVEIHTNAQIGGATSAAATIAIIPHIITKGDPVWIEILVFMSTCSGLGIIAFLLGSKIKRNVHDSDDGYLSYIGQTYNAVKGNSDGHGLIKINDKVFRFRSDQKIKKNDKVELIEIKGVTFDVKRKEV